MGIFRKTEKRNDLKDTLKSVLKKGIDNNSSSDELKKNFLEFYKELLMVKLKD